MAVTNNAMERKFFEIRKKLKEISEIVELKTIYGKGLKLVLSTYDEDEILLEDLEVTLKKPMKSFVDTNCIPKKSCRI